jgi:hypothetical protein
MNFKYKNKNGEFIWKNNTIKIVFSNPTFQAINEYICVKSMSEILYYYYTVSIYRRNDKYNEYGIKNKEKWKLVARRSTYDFPCIEQLVEILEDILKKDIKLKECQKLTYYCRGNDGKYEPSGNVGYEYRRRTEGFACDDFYEITKTLIRDEDKSFKDGDLSPYGKPMYHDEDREKFSIYIGCSYDSQGDINSEGVRQDKLTREDLEKLLKCVNDFIDYSISIHNESVFKSNEIENQSYEIKENKIYQYKIEDDKINKNKIDSLYYVGMLCSNIVVLKNGENPEEAKSIDFYNTTIDSIENDGFTVIGGNYKEDNDEYIQIENPIKINLNEVIYIFDDVNDKQLSYNEDEIAEDFVDILTQNEKDEFKEKTNQELFSKWCEAIINKTWVCRDEHHLEKRVKKDKNHNNVKEAVKVIIEKIRTLV